MGTPLYTTDVIPLTSRPTLTVMDDGDYFAILDTSTGKISKILRTDVQKALSISYNNATSGLTATQVQAALDELVVNLGSSDNAISALGGRLDILEGDELTEGSVAYDIKQSSDALKGTGYTEGSLKTHEDRLDTLESDDTTEGSVAYDIKQSSDAIKGVGYTDGTLKTHEDRLDTLEGADTVVGSVAKSIKDAVADLAGTGRTTETVKGNADAIALRELSANKVTAFQETPDDTHYPSEKLVDDSLEAIKGVDYTDGTLKSHEDRLDTLEGDDTVEGSVAKTVKDAVTPIVEDVSDHETRIDSVELTLARQGQDLASVKQTLQQGNGATLDFSGIGSVALDARATGRANPTVKGLTATNLVVNGDFADGLTGINHTFGSENISVSGGVASLLHVGGFRFFYVPFDVKTGDNFYAFVRYRITAPSRSEALDFYTVDDTSGGTIIWNTRETFSMTELPVDTSEYFLREGFLQATKTNNYLVLGAFPSAGTESFFEIDYFAIVKVPDEIDTIEKARKSILHYFNGTKSIQLPARVRSVSEDESESSTLYIADNEGVRSIQDVQDTLTMVNGEYIYTKKVSTPASVASGVEVNVTNYPTAKTGGKFAVELTAGGTQIGVIGTDSTSGAGTLRFELATPVTTNLLTSGILQAKSNGTVYYEPYYEGSHQTDASSQITLPYEGTIDKVYGYDEDLVEYLLDSSEYSLTGTTLTITGALENEVFYVQMSRSEPLAPEMSVNVINNDQVTLDSADGKYYQIGFATTNGVPTVTATEVV